VPLDYESILASLKYGRSVDNTAMATGLPLGYGQGFKVTWTAPGTVTVGPGAANVSGIQVAIDQDTVISESMWLVVRNENTHYYIYLMRDGNFEVDTTAPVLSTNNDFYNYHPITGGRFIGRFFTDSNKDTVFATTGTKSVPEVWVSASTFTDIADYQCDGTADEVQINAAVSYLAEAFAGGVISLSSGTFTLGDAVDLKSNIILTGAGAGTVLEPAPSAGAIRVTGTDGNEIAGAGIRHFKIKRTAVLTADCEDVNLDYADRFFANAVEFDADAAIASPDPYDHTVIKADNCDDLFVMACVLRMAGRGIRTTRCTGQILANAISMSAPADKQYTIGVQVDISQRFHVADNTISDLLNSRPGQANLRAIYVSGSQNSSIQNNSVSNIRATANTNADSSCVGISASGAWGGAGISGNMITGVHDWHAGEVGGASGILIHSGTDDVNISGNHIEHADTGIRIDAGSCDRTIVSGNFVTNCGQLISDGNCEDAYAPMVLEETVPYSAGSGGSYALSAAQAYEGGYSYLLTGDGVGDCLRDFMDDNNTANMHGLLAGVEYTLEVWVYVVAPLLAAEVQFYIYDYTGGWASTRASPVGQNAWEKVAVTRTVRVGATGTTARFMLNTGHSPNEKAYIDNVRLFPTNHQNAHENCLEDNGTDTRF